MSFDTFEAELVRHMPGLETFTRKLTRNRTDAEDVAQEAIARALRYRKRFRTGTNMQAWLRSIARNVWYAELQRYRARLSGEAVAERLIEATQEHGLHLQDIIKAIGRDGPLLLVLANNGMDYRRTSNETGIPTGTIKSRTYRARLKLAYQMAV